jgi:hypothetical protein
MSEDEILNIIQTRLTINITTDSVYTGNEDRLYSDEKTVQLLLDDEVISECSI